MQRSNSELDKLSTGERRRQMGGERVEVRVEFR